MSFYIQTGNGFTIISGGGHNEKTNYGRETVSDIDVSSSVRLNGTTVQGTVDAGGSVTASNANVGSIDSGGSTTLNSTKCKGTVDAGGSISATNSQSRSLDAGGSITVVNSKITNKVDAGGSVTANSCDQLGSVRGGGSVTIDSCKKIGSVSAGSHISLCESLVEGNVLAGSDATIQQSKINGTLTCTSKHLVIENSTIDTIRLRCSNSVSVNSGGITISGGNIMIGGGSNPNNIFINGVRLSQLQSHAPSEQENSPKQILELRNCTVKNVIFEGGNGEVILDEDSELSGNITGGKIRE